MAYREGMLSAKQAALKAAEFLKEVSLAEPEGLRVEEISRSDERWLVTLGFLGDDLVQQETSPLLFGPTAPQPRKKREYKQFSVRADDGVVEDMAIRTV